MTQEGRMMTKLGFNQGNVTSKVTVENMMRQVSPLLVTLISCTIIRAFGKRPGGKVQEALIAEKI